MAEERQDSGQLASPKGRVIAAGRVLEAGPIPLTWRDVTERVRFDRARYMPHQGQRECARRRSRMEAEG